MYHGTPVPCNFAAYKSVNVSGLLHNAPKGKVAALPAMVCPLEGDSILSGERVSSCEASGAEYPDCIFNGSPQVTYIVLLLDVPPTSCPPLRPGLQRGALVAQHGNHRGHGGLLPLYRLLGPHAPEETIEHDKGAKRSAAPEYQLHPHPRLGMALAPSCHCAGSDPRRNTRCIA